MFDVHPRQSTSSGSCDFFIIKVVMVAVDRTVIESFLIGYSQKNTGQDSSPFSILSHGGISHRNKIAYG